jgi:hypothetical protein
MSNELKNRIAALRGMSPRLNSVTDQVSEFVRTVEKTLVEELNIGIEASVRFHSEPASEKGILREHLLAFGRVASAGYRLHVVTRTVRESPQESTGPHVSESLHEEQILWPSCSRELKLKAFDKLPELLDGIVKNAEGLLQTAERAAAKIKEMVGEFDGIAQSRESFDRSGRSRRRRGREYSYSVNDARRAHRQYLLDQGLSEAAIGTFCLDGWEDEDSNRFVNRDGWGKVRCTIEFQDEEGNAEITFADGESDSVTLEDED